MTTNQPGIPNPAPAATNSESAASNGQNRAQQVDPERIAELERKLEEAKRQIADSTARIERALGR
jgi:hypothetical protein